MAVRRNRDNAGARLQSKRVHRPGRSVAAAGREGYVGLLAARAHVPQDPERTTSTRRLHRAGKAVRRPRPRSAGRPRRPPGRAVAKWAKASHRASRGDRGAITPPVVALPQAASRSAPRRDSGAVARTRRRAAVRSPIMSRSPAVGHVRSWALVAFVAADRSLELPESLAERASGLGKAPGPEEQERHDQNQDQVGRLED